MKTLLAVDGSDNSYEAVHALKYIARAEQLTLLHALNVPRPAYPIILPEVAEDLYKTYRRFPVCCPVTYHAGPFQGLGTIWNLSCTGVATFW